MENPKSNSNDLIVVAHAKINLHLEVLGLRTDGYHELAMVMQSIDLCDHIKMIKNDNNNISLKSTNKDLSNGDDNLIMKAANLLRDKAGINNLGVNIELIKNIPIGAGLAGGSTDAAATMVGLNRLWNLNLEYKEIEDISKEIGSDVPFCVSGGRQICFGRGEVLEKINSNTYNMGVLLVKDPLIQISTPFAYKKYQEDYGNTYLKSEMDFEKKRNEIRSIEWTNDTSFNKRSKIYNDLQKTVSRISPEVQKSLEILSNLPGSRLVSMSGSGPSCFALFSNFDDANNALKQNYQKFKRAGLSAWACSMKSNGVQFENEFV